MSILNESLSKLLDEAQSLSRRSQLIDEMNALERRGAHCGACSGVCCTFQANSMKVTLLEGLELLSFLEKEKRLTEKLIQELGHCVERYGLDRDSGNGKRVYARKTYTCPFFDEDKTICTISRKVKPYGCLGFNPSQAAVEAGEGCHSNIELLESREDRFNQIEEKLNFQLKTMLNWPFFDKLPIPSMLLKLVKMLEK